MRAYGQNEHDGVPVWGQKRGKGKHEMYSICNDCAVKDCQRAIGLRNFCEATHTIVVVWACEHFEAK